MSKNLNYKEIVDKILSLSTADETEIMIFRGENALTRFAQNYIHQNVAEDSISIRVRTVIGKKTASASTNSLSDKSLKETVQTAINLTKQQKDNEKLMPLQGMQKYEFINKYFSATAKATPQYRANEVIKAVNMCKENGLTAAGIYETGLSEIVIANSNGLFVNDKATHSDFDISVMSDSGAGWSAKTDKNVKKINVEQVTRIAIEKAEKSRFPKEVEPGKYTVILEPSAVAELTLFMAWLGFNGMDYLEGTSFLCKYLGKKVFSDKLTIIDDPKNEQTAGLAFDFEGTPTRKITLIENGIPKNFVTNRWIAQKTGVKNTGHATPLPSQNAYPSSMIIKHGEIELAKIIKDTEKAILVTRFHYTNVIDPMELIITGMTRDGLFLIENGEITKPLRNMRFTQSLIKAFSNIEEIGKEVEFASGFFGGGFIVPGMKINNFNFSSKTDF